MQDFHNYAASVTAWPIFNSSNKQDKLQAELLFKYIRQQDVQDSILESSVFCYQVQDCLKNLSNCVGISQEKIQRSVDANNTLECLNKLIIDMEHWTKNNYNMRLGSYQNTSQPSAPQLGCKPEEASTSKKSFSERYMAAYDKLEKSKQKTRQ